MVWAEIGLVDGDRGLRYPQRDVPASVLVDGSACGQSPNLERIVFRVRGGLH